MNVYQVISVFKHDLDFQIQLEATFKSFKNAKNFVHLKIKCLEKIDGPRYTFENLGEYIGSCRIDGIPCGFEEFYIKTCRVLDGKKEEKPETVTEFADRCRECGAKYGKLLKQMKWIPVSKDDLPKDYEEVIASTELGVFPEARYSKNFGWEWAYSTGEDYWMKLEGVMAWMPLPKEYEPESEEE